jgi:hypothetical protein
MKKIIALVVVISLVIFMLFSVSGCKVGQKIAEKVSEEAVEKAIEENIEAKGGEAEVEVSEGETTIKTNEGEVTVGQGTELPDGFPDVVPIYSNMEITSSWKGTEDGKATFSVSALTSDPGSTVFDWYKSKLGGWENEGEFTSESEGQILSTISVNNGTYNLVVTIIETDEGTTVGVVVSEM